MTHEVQKVMKVFVCIKYIVTLKTTAFTSIIWVYEVRVVKNNAARFPFLAIYSSNN